MFAAPNAQVALFLRHLWTTVGCVALDAKQGIGLIYHGSTSRQLIDDVRQLFLRFGNASRSPCRPTSAVQQCGSTMRFNNAVQQCGSTMRFNNAVQQCGSTMRKHGPRRRRLHRLRRSSAIKRCTT
jgi:LAGLIDADG-like domain